MPDTVYLDMCAPGKLDDLKSKNRRILSKFSPLKDTITVFPAAISSQEQARAPKGSFQQDQTVTCVPWTTKKLDQDRTMLINSSSSTFISSQDALRHGCSLQQVLNVSNMYVTQLNTFIEEMQSENHVEQVNRASELTSIWKLTETFFLKNKSQNSPGNVVSRMIEWVQQTQTDETIIGSLIDDISMHPNPHRHAMYWTTVNYCLLRGFVGKTVKLLGLHSDKQSSSFSGIVAALKDMPLLSNFSLSQVNVFKQRWMEWRTQLSFIEQDMSLSGNNPLNTVFNILSGNKSSIYAACSEDEIIVGVVAICLYSGPTFTVQDLVNVYKQSKNIQQFDHTLLSILEQDVVSLLRNSSKIDLWLVTHLSDILCRLDLIPEKSDLIAIVQEFGLGDYTKLDLEAIRTFFVRNYAEHLYQNGMWLLALHYYRFCGLAGRASISIILERMCLDDDFTSEKLIGFCRDYGYIDELIDIHSVLAKNAISQGKLGRALLNYSLALEFNQVANVVNNILCNFWCDKMSVAEFNDISMISGEFVSQQLQLINLGDCQDSHLISRIMSVKNNSHLEFLHKYAEFVQLKSESKRQAASLLCLMFTSNLIPREWWSTVFVADVNELIKHGDILFDTNECFELMRIHQEIKFSIKTVPIRIIRNSRLVNVTDPTEIDQILTRLSFGLTSQLTSCFSQ